MITMFSKKLIASAMLILFIFTAVAPVLNATAAVTGTVYAGSGDWIITTPTTISDDNLTVDGNIVVDAGGSLTIQNSELYANNIFVVQGASLILAAQTSLFVSGIYVNDSIFSASGTAIVADPGHILASGASTISFSQADYRASTISLQGTSTLYISSNSLLNGTGISLYAGTSTIITNSSFIEGSLGSDSTDLIITNSTFTELGGISFRNAKASRTVIPTNLIR